MKNKSLPFFKIYNLLLIIGCASGSLVFYNALSDPTLLPRFVVLIAFFNILLGVVLISGKSREFFANLFDYPILLAFGLFLCYAFSLTYANVFSEAIFQVERSFLFVNILLFSAFAIKNSTNYEAGFIKMTIVYGWIVLIIAYFQIQKQTDFSDWYLYFIHSIAGHKNLLSSLLFLLIIFCIAGITVLPWYWKLISTINIGLYFWLIAFIQTKSVWLAIAICVSSVTILTLINLRGKIKNWVWLIILIGFIITILFSWYTLTHFANDQQRSKLEFWKYGLTFSGRERMVLWEKTLCALKNKWIFGCGSGQWQFTFLECNVNGLEDSITQNYTFQRPHNDFLWVLSEVGIIGLLFFLLVYFIPLWYAFQFILTKRISESWLIILYSSGIIGYLAISFFDFPKERMEHTVLSGTMLILLYHKTSPKISIIDSWRGKTLPFLPIIWGLILVLTSITLYYRWKGEKHSKKMREFYITGNYNSTMVESKKSITRWYTVDITSMPVAWYQGVAGFYLQIPDKGLAYCLEAYKLNPNNIHVLNNLGSAYEANGSHALAKQSFIKAIEFFNLFDAAKFNLAVILYNEGKYQESYDLVKTIKTDSSKKETFLKVIGEKLIK